MKVKDLLLKSNKVSLRDKIFLLAHLLKVDHKKLYLMDDFDVPKDIEVSFLKSLERLEGGYPLQYLLGEWDFYGRTFYVEEGVLIPRPETERLVEETLKRIPRDKKTIGLEIGVGAGCISITLLIERNKLKMFANDINLKALKLAKKNAERYAVSRRLFLFGEDLFEAIKPMPFDFIVSNPPYIPEYEWGRLPEGVKIEGYSSLIGGPKGWEFYQRIASHIDAYLKADGFFAFEIGHDQGDVVKEIFEKKGYKVEVNKDYSGQDRVVVGWRS